MIIIAFHYWCRFGGARNSGVKAPVRSCDCSTHHILLLLLLLLLYDKLKCNIINIIFYYAGAAGSWKSHVKGPLALSGGPSTDSASREGGVAEMPRASMGISQLLCVVCVLYIYISYIVYDYTL